MNQLIQFYEGNGNDHAGRKIFEILSWGDQELESCHDYIQWLFPLREKSIYNHFAPILDNDTVDIFRRSSSIHQNMKLAIDRMKIFYKFEAHHPKWVTFKNHNYLRLSRIIASCNILGHHDAADEIYANLSRIYSAHQAKIGTDSMNFWKESLKKT